MLRAINLQPLRIVHPIHANEFSQVDRTPLRGSLFSPLQASHNRVFSGLPLTPAIKATGTR